MLKRRTGHQQRKVKRATKKEQGSRQSRRRSKKAAVDVFSRKAKEIGYCVCLNKRQTPIYDNRSNKWVNGNGSSPSIRLLVSVSAQHSALVVSVLFDLYAFHRSIGNSLCPYSTPVLLVSIAYPMADLKGHLQTLYAQLFRITLAT